MAEIKIENALVQIMCLVNSETEQQSHARILSAVVVLKAKLEQKRAKKPNKPYLRTSKTYQIAPKISMKVMGYFSSRTASPFSFTANIPNRYYTKDMERLKAEVAESYLLLSSK